MTCFSSIRTKCSRNILLSGALLVTLGLSNPASAGVCGPRNHGKWISGDFHQHTTYTDGSNPIATVMAKNLEFGLDWWANSEHGGGFTRDGFGPVLVSGFDTAEYARFWDNTGVYPAGLILGDVSSSGGHRNMWRWQSIRDFSFNDVLTARATYRDKLIIQGLEWNMPGHEHCSTAIMTNQFKNTPDASPMAEFEYKFDNSDTDTTGGAAEGWAKSALTGHAKAVEAAAWMQANHPKKSWLVPAHPERRASYRIEHFRDLNNAGPDVAFGFEGLPGHQKEGQRGSYSTSAVGGGTYGGAGIYIAKVGGLWDALLGEGRNWWTFVSSDFHNTVGDFWPGEYAKTWVFAVDKNGNRRIDPRELADALRSGNAFCVHGDLIKALDFSAQNRSSSATIGERLTMRKGDQLKIKIRFKSPAFNNNNDPVMVDHIDLIAGDITGPVAPTLPDGTPNPEYAKDTNESTRVLATFTEKDWQKDCDGWNTIVYHIKKTDRSMYFRLRGTNLAPETDFETDKAGNPLADSLGPEPGPGWRRGSLERFVVLLQPHLCLREMSSVETSV